jgi:hypothetical protein
MLVLASSQPFSKGEGLKKSPLLWRGLGEAISIKLKNIAQSTTLTYSTNSPNLLIFSKMLTNKSHYNHVYMKAYRLFL